MGACPPTRIRPSGSSAAVLWYVRFSVAGASFVHVFVLGSNSSGVVTGIAVPGPSTSSALAPEKAMTSPVGVSTPVPYHRGWLREPVDADVTLVESRSTVSMRLSLTAKYVPGVVPMMAPAVGELGF